MKKGLAAQSVSLQIVGHYRGPVRTLRAAATGFQPSPASGALLAARVPLATVASGLAGIERVMTNETATEQRVRSANRATQIVACMHNRQLSY